MYEKLVPQGVYVAADVFGTVIDNETDQDIVGQDYVQMAEYLDYICPMVYPSHYYSGSYGIAIPDADPYATIYAAASSSVQQLQAVPEETRAQVRPWLQGFTASWVAGHISYGREQIRAQIKETRRIMPGMLYLCATPIGNLGDMTQRVIETLRSVDLIAAEDTRNSIKLLNHFEIKTSMTSYHEYNKVEKADYLVGLMKQGLR